MPVYDVNTDTTSIVAASAIFNSGMVGMAFYPDSTSRNAYEIVGYVSSTNIIVAGNVNKVDDLGTTMQVCRRGIITEESGRVLLDVDAAFTSPMAGWRVELNLEKSAILNLGGYVSGSKMQLQGDPLFLADLRTERYHIAAPPGVCGANTGTSYSATGATADPRDRNKANASNPGSRYLWAGYMYLTPIVGVWTGSSIQGSQSGINKLGLYHCWNRDYDPSTGSLLFSYGGDSGRRPNPSDVLLAAEDNRCGPDITDWIKKEIKIWTDWAKTMSNNADRWGSEDASFYEPDIVYQKSYKYAILYAAAKQMTYAPDTDFASKNCPLGEKCKNTVTLCGKCIHKSEVGNFLYGAVARTLGMTWLQTWAGAKFGNRGKQTEADKGSVELGWDYMDNDDENDICEMFKKDDYADNWTKMQSDADSSCKICPEKVDSEKNHVELPDADKIKKDDDIDVNVPKKVE